MEIGELVFDKDTGVQVRVLERTEVWDYVTYRVFDGHGLPRPGDATGL